MAQRSKFIGATSRNEFWAPQEGKAPAPDYKANFTVGTRLAVSAKLTAIHLYLP